MRRYVFAVIVLVLSSAAPTAAQTQDPYERTPRQPRSPAGATPAAPAPPPPAPAAPPDDVGAGPVHRHDPGIAPTAPSGGTSSRGASVLSHVDTTERAIALTLDDGFNPDPRVLDLIESYGVRGTAFIVGQVADTNPALLHRLVELDWMVCSHSYSHRQLTTLASGAIASEIVRGVEAVERVVGYRCPYFRAPFGSVDSRVVAEARALDLEIIGWDASLSDSAPAGTDPQLQIEVAQRDLTPGTILLGHFGATNSFEVLSGLLEWLDESGYAVGSVEDLISGDVPPLDRPTLVEVDDTEVEAAQPVEDTSTLSSYLALPGAEAAPVAVCLGVFLVVVARRRSRRQHRLPDDLPPRADDHETLSRDRVPVGE